MNSPFSFEGEGGRGDEVRVTQKYNPRIEDYIMDREKEITVSYRYYSG